MNRVKGQYEIHEFGVLLALKLDKKTFDKFVDHINKNMFFSYRRLASRFKKVATTAVPTALSRPPAA